jgi:predicted ATPase
MPILVNKVKFINAFRMFPVGWEMSFKDITLLVGDQGTGKSSLIDAVWKSSHPKPVAKIDANGKKVSCKFFDFEKHNPRLGGNFNMAMDKVGGGAALAGLYSSHGQVVNALLGYLNTVKDNVILLDEPDMALSIKSVVKLAKLLKVAVANGNQVIAAVHNPLLIERVGTVFSMEHNKWMDSKDFIQSQLA